MAGCSSASTAKPTVGTTASVAGVGAGASDTLRQCRWVDASLRVALLPDLSPGQHRLDLAFAKSDKDQCQTSGYPDVELIGPNIPPASYSVIDQLPHPDWATPTVVLGEDGVVHAVLTYEEPRPENTDLSNPYVPGYLRVVLPGDNYAFGVPWTFGPVLYMDGATHPANFIGPIQSGTE